MALLVDLFGYLGILLHGLVIVSQSMALGGAGFLVLLRRWPQAIGPDQIKRVQRMALLSALALALVELISVAMQSAVLISTVGLSLGDVLAANFALCGLAKAVAAAGLAVALVRGMGTRVLSVFGIAILIAAIFTTHAAARLDHNSILLAAAFLHQSGATIWIGAIPSFVLTLPSLSPQGLRVVGAGFSRMSMAGVAAIVISGVTMSFFYIGSWEAAYGTAYGVMVGAKVAMFLMLMGLGYANFRVTERLRHDPTTPILRLRRFAEVEIGIGFTIFFCAASLTSVPPGADLPQDRVSWSEIVARDFTLVPPRFSSPDHDKLSLPALQKQLDAEAAAKHAAPLPAFIEGSGDIASRNADDIAWSEYNHHWAGIFVITIGLLALLQRAGVGIARHWPLVFLGLAGFLLIRSDPEVWPLGQIGLIESLRDVEVLQHRAFALLVVIFGVFEWSVRVGWLKSRAAAYVFPLICAFGGALLLTHTHAIANLKDQLLIELTHTPLALAAVVAGWARWLELRLPGRVARVCAVVWPVCFVFIGVLLVLYREA